MVGLLGTILEDTSWGLTLVQGSMLKAPVYTFQEVWVSWDFQFFGQRILG